MKRYVCIIGLVLILVLCTLFVTIIRASKAVSIYNAQSLITQIAITNDSKKIIWSEIDLKEGTKRASYLKKSREIQSGKLSTKIVDKYDLNDVKKYPASYQGVTVKYLSKDSIVEVYSLKGYSGLETYFRIRSRSDNESSFSDRIFYSEKPSKKPAYYYYDTNIDEKYSIYQGRIIYYSMGEIKCLDIENTVKQGKGAFIWKIPFDIEFLKIIDQSGENVCVFHEKGVEIIDLQRGSVRSNIRRHS